MNFRAKKGHCTGPWPANFKKNFFYQIYYENQRRKNEKVETDFEFKVLLEILAFYRKIGINIRACLISQ